MIIRGGRKEEVILRHRADTYPLEGLTIGLVLCLVGDGGGAGGFGFVIVFVIVFVVWM